MTTASTWPAWYLLLWKSAVSMMSIAMQRLVGARPSPAADNDLASAPSSPGAIPVAILGCPGLATNLAPAVTTMRASSGPGNFNDVPIIGWIVIGLTALTTLIVARSS